MNESRIISRLFDRRLDADKFALDKLWNEYSKCFSLEKDQPDYYNGDFLRELNALKEAEVPGKKLYFFHNTSGSSGIVGMSMLCATDESKVCEIKKVLILQEFRGKGYG